MQLSYLHDKEVILGKPVFFGNFGGHLGLAVYLWDYIWHNSFFVKWCIVWIGCFFILHLIVNFHYLSFYCGKTVFFVIFHIFFTFCQKVKGHNFVNFIPIGLKFGMCMPDHDPNLICSLCSYHICTIKKFFKENLIFRKFWRPSWIGCISVRFHMT